MLNEEIRRPESLAAVVAERIRRAILQTEVKLGEALSEDRIASALGVSRTPVREAFTMLQLQGLITVVPQRGSFVFLPSDSELAELCEYRRMIEIQGAAQSMRWQAYAAGQQLQEAHAAMVEAQRTRDALGFAAADSLFHEAFLNHCENRYLQEAYALASVRLAAVRSHLAAPLLLDEAEVVAEHEAILRAFLDADLAELDRLLGIHIVRMCAFYARAIRDELLAVGRGANAAPKSRWRVRPLEVAPGRQSRRRSASQPQTGQRRSRSGRGPKETLGCT